MKQYLTVSDLMQRYGVGEHTIRKALQCKAIPSLHMGRRYIVPLATLEEFERRKGADYDSNKEAGTWAKSW